MTMQPLKPQSIFPDVPRDPKVIDEQGNMVPEWYLYFSLTTQALQINFKNEGIVAPPLTASNIALLTGIPSYNNILFDSTNGAFKGNIAGTWKTFTLT